MTQYVGVLQNVRLFLHNQENLIDIFNYALNCINKKVGITAISEEQRPNCLLLVLPN